MTIIKRKRVIERMLFDLGIFQYLIEIAGKHLKVQIIGPLGQKVVIAACSPSDHRAMMNFRTDVRRIAREVGALPA